MHPIHPMLVHFPIALLTTGWLFDLLAVWRQDERLRESGWYLSITGLLSAGAAVVTGHFAEEAVEHSGIPKPAIEIHEELTFVAAGIFAALVAWRFAMRMGLMPEKRVLVLVVGAVGLLVLFVASYFGGDLVYRYGAGVLPK